MQRCFVFAVVIASGIGLRAISLAQPPAPERAPPPNFKIAFIGDSGIRAGADRVAALIRSEGAQVVVHAGDLDYEHSPAGTANFINRNYGENFPYFFCVGNHDTEQNKWPEYQAVLETRFRRMQIPWKGQLGRNSSWRYKNIFFVSNSTGLLGTKKEDAARWIRDEMAGDASIWRISFWHYNQNKMQTGAKGDQAGWGVYEESRKAGALIATGHEHAYSRSHLLSNCEKTAVASTSGTLTIRKDDPATRSADEGRTFVFVSGVGGREIRVQKRSGPWWARIYTSKCRSGDPACQQAADKEYGVLFGEFHVDGQPNKARFRFKTVQGRVLDEFTVFSDAR